MKKNSIKTTKFGRGCFLLQCHGDVKIKRICEHHILARVEDGKIRLNDGRESRVVQKEGIVFIPAGLTYEFCSCDTTCSVAFHYVGVRESLYGKPVIVPTWGTKILAETVALQGLAGFLFDRDHSSTCSTCYEAEFRTLWAKLCEHVSPPVTYIDPELITSLDTVRQYISDNSDYQHKLDTLANIANLDRWALCKIHKRVFGISLFQHLHIERVKESKEKLLQGERQSDIALDSGFSDQSHYCRYFKRYTGLSPTNWLYLMSQFNKQDKGFLVSRVL